MTGIVSLSRSSGSTRSASEVADTIVSFLLGAATAFSLVVLCSNLSRERHKKDHSDDTLDCYKSDLRAPVKEELYDTPDLDLRLIRKAEAVIQGRTDKLILVVERCTNDHNYSAILRTAEALGIQTVCLIDPPPATIVNDVGAVVLAECETKDESQLVTDSGLAVNHSTFLPKARLSEAEQKAFCDHRRFAQNATEWLTIREFPSAMECIDTLHTEGFSVWVTDLSQAAVPLTRRDLQQHSAYGHANAWPFPPKMALVMGTEAVGCSVDMLTHADVRVYLPLTGFADSLNLSVATALVVQQVFHLHPSYQRNMSDEHRQALRQLWFPKLAQQRLLSARAKKQRRAILKQIEACARLMVRHEAGDDLTREQVEKMAQLSEHEAALRALELESSFDRASVAVADLIAHPPSPLTDLRRADPHRVTFVGKNVKRKHAQHWKDMVATSHISTPRLATASFFRDRIGSFATASTQQPEEDL
jgi:tRNA G18 (ribose-2'-O)-methylase SpoU